jgi:hypothetical protein
MGTPDGISSDDWDFVHELAIDIVNTQGDECEAHKDRLLVYLKQLEEKYGELPSIIATRADYINDVRQREQLLNRAYVLAEARDDNYNKLEIAHSLAELYIEKLKDAAQGQEWLECLKQHVDRTDDSSLAEEYKRLRQAWQELPSTN